MNLHTLRRTRGLALLAVGLAVSGCSTWKPLREPVAEAFSAPEPESHVLIHTVTGERVEFAIHEVTADSLRGWTYGRNPRWKSDEPSLKHGHRLSIAHADIAKIESRQKDGALTALLVLGIVGVVVVAIGAIAMSQMDSWGFGAEWQ